MAFSQKEDGTKKCLGTDQRQKSAGRLQRWLDKYADMGKIILWLKILVSCLPAMIIGLPLMTGLILEVEFSLSNVLQYLQLNL